MTTENQKLIRSFGRIKSRKLSDSKQKILNEDLKSFQFPSADIFKSNDYSQYEKRSFEIGFGFGDFTHFKAKNNEKQIFFGSEPHINGVVNLVSLLTKDNLDNVKISTDDARLLLEKFEDNFFDNIFILFPDPWPKIKHFKRRIINSEFLDNLLAKKLKKSAEILIATDHDSYKIWICRELLKLKNFSWQFFQQKDWLTAPDQWIETKYQKKAIKEGRKSVFFKLRRL